MGALPLSPVPEAVCGMLPKMVTLSISLQVSAVPMPSPSLLVELLSSVSFINMCFKIVQVLDTLLIESPCFPIIASEVDFRHSDSAITSNEHACIFNFAFFPAFKCEACIVGKLQSPYNQLDNDKNKPH